MVKAKSLELRLMMPSDAPAAANLLKKARSSWSEVSSSFYDEHILPELVNGLSRQQRPVVLGVIDGKICAAYDPPDFVLERSGVVLGKKESFSLWGVTYEGVDDYFAVEPEREGIGTAFFGVFVKVLDGVARAIGSSLTHRIQATHRSRKLFENFGYRVRTFSPGLTADYFIVERVYWPEQHPSLVPAGVVSAFLNQLSKQAGMPGSQ